MAIDIPPLQPDLPSIRKRLRAPHSLWRLFGWGGTATIALAVAAIASQTEAGGKRLQFAIGYLSDPVHMVADLSQPARTVVQIPPPAAEAKTETQNEAAIAETRRLAAQLRDLTADRERLSARIAALEHNFDDITGSIKQQTEQLAAARAAMIQPPVSSAAAMAPPAISVALPPLVPLELPAIQTTTAAENSPQQAAETKANTVALPKIRVAATAVSAPAAGPTPAAKAEFGIDLGGAATIEALRSHWTTVKANYGPLLLGLHPLAAHYPKQPAGVAYRLVAGPLPNAAEATKLCARFPVTRTRCHPAKFDGAQLVEH